MLIRGIIMYGRFEELKVWQKGREFRNEVYRMTQKFPKTEIFGLISQMRRASISITSNIAEGHGRFHFKENIQFCRISRGSLNEILDQLYLALDMGYINKTSFSKVYENGRELEKMLNGYVSFLEKKCGEK